MTEPFYIAQTFEPEHVVSLEAAHAWQRHHVEASKEEGGTFARFSQTEDGSGLLFECWKKQPKNQGEPRWNMVEASA